MRTLSTKDATIGGVSKLAVNPNEKFPDLCAISYQSGLVRFLQIHKSYR